MKRKVEKHIFKEGSLDHVLWWDRKGRHCNIKNCEINQRKKSEVNHES